MMHSSRVSSIADIPGSQLWFIVEAPESNGSLRQSVGLIELEVGRGHAINIKGEDMRKYTLPDGKLAYEYVVPKDWFPARELCRSR